MAGARAMRAMVMGLAGCLATADRAAACGGDCDGDGAVMVSELIACVTIALGSPLAGCPACDGNGDATVAIDELIAAVGHALHACPPTTPASPTVTAIVTPTGPPPACGNGRVDVEGEQCDDGNAFGGDGCAANCTLELRRTAIFDVDATHATVQSQAVAFRLDHLAGLQVLTTGTARESAVFGQDGTQRFAAGDIPVVLRRADLRFEPISLPGLLCACVRGVDTPEFGPGNAAVGVIGCGSEGPRDLDTTLRRDHDTTPGSATNGGPAAGLPDDPECDDCADSDLLGRSCACREGADPACSPLHRICNSPHVVERAGGSAPRGGALLSLHMAIGLLADTGTCDQNGPRPNGSCAWPVYGDDCLPCTDDDADLGRPTLVTATTGLAVAHVYDANLSAGAEIGPQAICFGPACIASVSGAPFDCDRLAAEPAAGLSGGALGLCFPSVDAAIIGDSVTCARLTPE